MTGTRSGSGARNMAFGKRVDGPAARRRATRSPVAIRGEVVTQSETIEVRLIDISKTGAKLHGAALPAGDQPVLVRIGPMEAYGTVAWSDGELCGIRFASPVGDDDGGSQGEAGGMAHSRLCPNDPR